MYGFSYLRALGILVIGGGNIEAISVLVYTAATLNFDQGIKDVENLIDESISPILPYFLFSPPHTYPPPISYSPFPQQLSKPLKIPIHL